MDAKPRKIVLPRRWRIYVLGREMRFIRGINEKREELRIARRALQALMEELACEEEEVSHPSSVWSTEVQDGSARGPGHRFYLLDSDSGEVLDMSVYEMLIEEPLRGQVASPQPSQAEREY